MLKPMILAVVFGAVATAGLQAAWDGQSWVYDTSRHVAANPSEVEGAEVALAATPRGIGVSADSWLDTVFMTFWWSNEIYLTDERPGLSIIFR